MTPTLPGAPAIAPGPEVFPPFDLLGPLPHGTTLLEASAGTGKTYTIAALVTRYIAEGAAQLAELLVVTFGRAATRELRERVRERIVGARDALTDPVAAAGGEDHLLRHLATGTPVEVAARRARLAAAAADFDAATIVTTHAFCQLVIRGLGTAADADPDTELVEDLTDVMTEVAHDFYLRKFADDGDRPAFDLKLARKIAQDGALDSHADLAPPWEAGNLRGRYAIAVRQEIARRLTARRAISFDDQLRLLRDVLRDAEAGPGVRARLREQYRVVLVDEFQDTDPVQWEILRTAFHGHGTLVLIGDPKQAIYAFRGGDVHSYLAAADAAHVRATLPANWRSDAAVLAGLAALLEGRALGDPRILVGPVRAAAPEPLLRDAAGGGSRPPVRLRLLPADGLALTSRGMPSAATARAAVTQDLVGEIVRVLTDGSDLLQRDGTRRPVRPGDIAVLVARNADGAQVRDALITAGVPTVLRATASVFGTAAATDWVALLEAVEQPHRVQRVRRLAVSAFIGMDAAGLDGGGERAHNRLVRQVRGWSVVLAERGVAALFAAVDAECGTLARLLGETGGERHATDLRHIADVLHAAAVAQRLGPVALLGWLRRRIAELDRDPTAERSRRLDSDAAAVQVVTVHMSKGLEFPLVHVPFAWSRFAGQPEVALFHDPASGRRTRHVGGPGSAGWDTSLTAHQAEQRGEDLRLLYVAATRARSQLTLWWARTSNSPTAALTSVLFDGHETGFGNALPGDEAALVHLSARAAAAGHAFAVEQIRAAPPATWVAPQPPAGTPIAARFDRDIDTAWRRTSYSALTAAAHTEPAVTTEPESTGTSDEPATTVEEPGEDAGPGVPSPFGDLPGGAAFGTLVHSVLEVLDPASGDLPAAVTEAVTAALARRPVVGVDPGALGAGLLAALRTPLGPLGAGRSLADFPHADRLCEMEFELPLAGGDAPGRQVVLGELPALLLRHLPAADPVRPYADRLAAPDLAGQPLRGYLTGSIDAVLRVPDPRGMRYLVVDYKTNVLHPPGDPSCRHYRPAALAAAMRAANYPLQAVLYQVALHRYLSWRQPGYDPDLQLGGVLYLYLRGMAGPAIPASGEAPDGVFAWRPPAGLVVAISDLLAGVRP